MEDEEEKFGTGEKVVEVMKRKDRKKKKMVKIPDRNYEHYKKMGRRNRRGNQEWRRPERERMWRKNDGEQIAMEKHRTDKERKTNKRMKVNKQSRCPFISTPCVQKNVCGCCNYVISILQN